MNPPSATLAVMPRTQGTFSAAVSERPYKRHQSEEPQQWNFNKLSDTALYEPWSIAVKTEIGQKGGCFKCRAIHQKGEHCPSKHEPYPRYGDPSPHQSARSSRTYRDRTPERDTRQVTFRNTLRNTGPSRSYDSRRTFSQSPGRPTRAHVAAARGHRGRSAENRGGRGTGKRQYPEPPGPSAK